MSMPNESQQMGGVQSSSAYQNRNAAMNEGINGGPVATSAGLQQQQAQENAAGPARVRPTGSGNGMSSDQAEATMSGQLPTANGQAASTYQSKKWFEPRNQ